MVLHINNDKLIRNSSNQWEYIMSREKQKNQYNEQARNEISKAMCDNVVR
jgi:hypothetical protein